ncbi:procollagen-lysine,2-oxoglutarate 5-dioxygenase 1-like isoform X1 [Artemia franciscana]|uniref:procollagen-lysine,2-oxoglutarate 5-dioxygenase 1-like isoform X1 n=1 Tax=Artemia franciscana TaxID=6661 RepID=UPI0032DA5786
MAAFKTIVSLVFVIAGFVLADESETGGKPDNLDFLVVTVATNETDGYNRFMRSAKLYTIPVKVLGMGEVWKGGDVKRTVGGGHKVNLLKKALEEYKDDKEKIVAFTDSYDVIFAGSPEKIIQQFKTFQARVVFSAEGFCWPDQNLADQYPAAPLRGKRFLNSGGFIGYASDLYEIVSHKEIDDSDDDQLYYTLIYLDAGLRDKFQMKLDHRAEIFQNLNGAVSDIEIRFRGKEAYVQNTAYKTVPLIVHGNGPAKLALNTLGNYLAYSWNEEDGCTACWEDMKSLEKKEEAEYPVVVMGVFIGAPTPFLEEFLTKISGITYPKRRIHLFIHNNAEYHSKQIEEFVKEVGPLYKSVKFIRHTDDIKEWHSRNLAIEECVQKKCDYYFNVDAVAQIDNPHILKLLIEQNRPIVAPMMIRPYKAWSNFWGSLTSDGFYARSFDYMDIVQNTKKGLWNVPYISGCYLVQGYLIHNPETKPSYINGLLDPDMAFCTNMREKDVFMYVSNRLNWGHLINNEEFDTSHLHNEMWEIFNNRWDWELRYLHPNYSHSLDPNKTVEQPCPDVFWFPLFSVRFTNELVSEMEHFGKWSDGSNYDDRLAGAYENVPTRDIHMNQIGYEIEWLHILKEYVRPLQERVFLGYFHDPPRSIMNFVVRYRPDEQPSLRPHHDSSTYTINVALNRAGIDYEGGGVRFIRYNCSLIETRQGWTMMHPGRLTHYHEGLTTTKGTRYIMISFIDP